MLMIKSTMQIKSNWIEIVMTVFIQVYTCINKRHILVFIQVYVFYSSYIKTAKCQFSRGVDLSHLTWSLTRTCMSWLGIYLQLAKKLLGFTSANYNFHFFKHPRWQKNINPTLNYNIFCNLAWHIILFISQWNRYKQFLHQPQFILYTDNKNILCSDVGRFQHLFCLDHWHQRLLPHMIQKQVGSLLYISLPMRMIRYHLIKGKHLN